MSNSDYIQKIVKGAFLVLISMVLGKFFSYLYIILVATKLGTHDYGVLSLGLAISSFLSAFSLLGLDESIIRFVSFYNGENNKEAIKGTILTSFKTVINSSVFFGILLIIFSSYLSDNIFKEYELTKVLLFVALTLPFGVGAQIFLASFRAFQKPEYEVLIKELLEKFSRLIITVILIFYGFKLTGALFGFFLAVIIMFFVAFFTFNKKIFNIYNKNIKSIENKKELLNYSLPLLLKNFMWFIVAWTDVLMIGYFKTISEVGIYNVALPTANLIIVPVYGIMYLFLPIISELYAKKKNEEIKYIYKKISKYTFVLNVPIFLIIFLLSKDIISLFFGKDYISASTPLIILSLGYLLYSLTDISMNMLSVMKKTKTIFSIIFLFGLSNIILNYFLIPKYDIIGAAIGTSISFVIGAILMVSASYKHTNLHPFMFKYYKVVIALILTFLISLSVRNLISFSPLINIISLCLIILISYTLLIILLKVFNKEDFKIIDEMKSKFLIFK